ncbi:MAG TPA: glycosyltransferase, partial [bacterium]|nr:glycosyltransferase [bacterium]
VPGGRVVVSAPRAGDWRAADREDPLVVSRPPFGRMGSGRFVAVLLWWLWALVLVIRHDVRFLHCGNVTPNGYVGYWMHRTLGLPYALYFHGMDVERFARKEARGGPRARVVRRILDRAAVVFANSRDTVARLERIGVAGDRIRLLHPGVDAERFRPGPVNDPALAALADGPTLLTVGRYARRKGVDLVLRALVTVRRRVPCRLLVSGRDQEENLRPLVDELGLGDAVRFLGEVPAAALPDLYRAADVFVMPAREEADTGSVEGFGIVFLEAAASGVPAVGGRSGGMGDAVADGETGFLVDPDDADGLAARLLEILEDPELAERLGRRGRERALADFSWDRAGRIVGEEVRRAVDSAPSDRVG